MAVPTGVFESLSAAELATLKTDTLACIQAVLKGNQAVSRSGISYTRADLQALKDLLGEILFSQGIQTGTDVTLGYVDLQ